MKKLLRRLISFSLCLMCIFSVFLVGASAQEDFTVMESDLEGYEYVKYNEPIEEFHNGRKMFLLGYLRPIDVDVNLEAKTSDINDKLITPRDNYREFDIYKVYNDGIIERWSWLSKDHFIISIARGMEYKDSETITAKIDATYTGTYTKDAKSAINSEFKINASGSKTVSHEVKFSGPDAPYNSRDFYYNEGRHTYDILVVQEHHSNWDGFLWDKKYRVEVGVPAIKSFSVDTF